MARSATATSASVVRRLAAPAVALALTALLAWAGALGRLDRAWHDFLQRQLAPRTLADPNTAIVLIDEFSMQEMGRADGPQRMRWPWQRVAFAGLISSLHRAGAKAIVVDLAFVEASPDAMHDTLLGAVAAGLPTVTLASLGDKRPSFWTDEFQRAHPELFASQPRWGSARTKPDEDGVYRRYPTGDSLVDAALGRPGDPVRVAPRLVRWRGSLKEVEARGVPVLPAVGFAQTGMMWLGDIATEVADFEPATLVAPLANKQLPAGPIFEAVRGRTVFVGANAAAAFDYIATPANSPEPGVLLHWNAWQNFAGDEFLAEPGPWLVWTALAAVVAAAALAGRRGVGLTRPALAAGGAAVLALGGSALAFAQGDLWFAPITPVAGAAISFTAVAVESFRRERARKREIQGWFGAYVSPSVVKRLVENPDALKLGGEKRNVSVFFCDLVGFTTMSEKLPDQQLVSVINLCLEEFSAPIFNHGGYLDKYIGDAIMGVFGSPEELENHALAATRAALECQRRLPALNERLQREFGVTVGVRFGINTGDATMGNVGSQQKKNYTALGDTVNLASRLEGANKEFHTQILLGPLTAARASAEILMRPVARLRVKGKTQAVEVFEPLGAISAADETSKRFAAACKEGFDAWSVRHFDQAARAFADALVLRPDDFLTTRYLDDARRLAATPPPPDWEPILNLESK